MIEPITSMKNAFDLRGQNAIVTGGNRGIGFAIASALAQVGANVAILCRDTKKAEEALGELEAYGGQYESFYCDVTDLAGVRKAVADVYAVFGEIHILVNNAGVSTRTAFLDMDENLSEWYRVINTDLNGVVHMTYEVGKRMRDADKGGSIINITSLSGIVVHRDSPRSPYNASKAGINHFTRAMAVELGKYNIRANAIAPGYIRTGFTANPTEEFVRFVQSQQPMDRLGEGIEVGALAVFLASPAAAHLTGTIQVIDGGFSLS
ncbi:MAG: SDR family oxidoreductase [Clostridiales bacterium]|nr:SDR family oxidoreductase [Clostridiales bacterium]